MRILRLSLFNLRKNRREALAIIFLTMITTMMLSICAANNSKVEKVFTESFEETGSVENIVLFDADRYHSAYRKILEENYNVTRLTENDMIFVIAGDAKDKDGTDIAYNLTFVNERTERRIESFKKSTSMSDEEISKLSHPVWLPVYFSIVKGYVPGDTFTVVKSGKEYPLTVAGFYETGLMSSDGFGFKLVVSDEDYDLFSLLFRSSTAKPFTGLCFDADENFSCEEYIEKCSISSSEDVPSSVEYYSFESEMQGEIVFIELFLFLLMFLAFVTLISAAFMIRNKISNDIEDQMQNIGVLEALGYRSKEISLAYLFEYVITGGAGSILGAALAAAATPFVNYGIEKMMGRRTYGSMQIMSILSMTVAVIFFVTIFALLKAGTVKKFPPVVALRRGIATHHFGGSFLPLEKAKGNINLLLGLKGLAGELKSAVGVAICITAAGCSILFSVVSYDFFREGTKGLETMLGVDVGVEIVKLVPGVDPYSFKAEVEELPEVRKALVTHDMKHISRKGSDTYGSAIVYDDYSELENLYVVQGRYPEHDNEVMLGMRRAGNENLSVGDKVTLVCNGLEKDYIIAGVASSMMNGGSSFYLTSGGYRRLDVNARPDQVNLYLTEGVDHDSFDEKLAALYGGTAKDAEEMGTDGASLEEKISRTAMEKIAVLMTQYGVTGVEYAVRIGDELITGNSRAYVINEITSWRGMIKSQMEPIAISVKQFTLVGALLIAMIVGVILWIIASSNVRRQRKNLGIMKSMGYSSKDLMAQIALRFMPVTLISLVIASVFTTYLNKWFWKVLFATKAETDPTTIIITDVVLALFCYFVTYIGAGRVKKISVTELMTE